VSTLASTRTRLVFSPDNSLYKAVSLLLIWTIAFSTLPVYGAEQKSRPFPRALRTGSALLHGAGPMSVDASLGRVPEASVANSFRGSRPKLGPKVLAVAPRSSLKRTSAPLVVMQAANPGLQVSVGFADSSSPSLSFPEPWNETNPAINFVGAGTSFQAGAIRLDNTATSPVTVDKVTVDLGRPGPVFELWTNFTLPANGSAILTQTQNGNFNSSASPIVGCGQPLAANETRIPKVTITIAGAGTDYLDTAHVLDTGGFNSSCRGNQSLDWRPIGTTGIAAPNGSVQLTTDGAQHDVGTPDTVSVQVNDAANQPLANAPVVLQVLNGPNAGAKVAGTTDGGGNAAIAYSGTLQGTDLVEAAVANMSGGALVSQQASTTWISASACPPAAAPNAVAAQMIYVGQASTSFGLPLLLAEQLTDGTGNPLSGRTVSFSFAGQTVLSTTDGNGVASVVGVTLPIGQLTVTASFAGDQSFLSAQSSATVTVQPTPTLLRYVSSNLITSLGSQSVTAILTDATGNTKIANRIVSFALNGVSASATTDSNGQATATLNFQTAQPTGAGQLQISFAGDADYQASTRTVAVQIFQNATFVIWGGNSGGLKIGQTVNFWGAQWESQATSGQFSAFNPSFKGFANSVVSPVLRPCQSNATPSTLTDACWSTKPGNSFPPSTIPSLIEVIVSTAIVQSGSEIFGNVACTALVQVNPSPAYGPSPGQPGFGVITAVNGDCGAVFPKPASLVATQQQTSPVLPGQQATVNYSITDQSTTDATGVNLNEVFDQVTPTTGSAGIGSIPAGTTSSGSFQVTIPAIGARQGTESSVDYEARLAGQDGRLFTSEGEVSFSDPFNQIYPPVDLSSSSLLNLPRLIVGLSGTSCIAPGATVPYQATIENPGSATATKIGATVTLPDKTTAAPAVPDLAAGTRTTLTIPWQSPGIAGKGAGESTQVYLARLQTADGVVLPAAVIHGTWQDLAGNSYGPVDQPFTTLMERVPVVTVVTPAGQALLPHQTTQLAFGVSNTGSGNAVQVTLQLKRQDGSVFTQPNFSLPGGQQTNMSLNYQAPGVAAKGASESDAAYLSRLSSSNGASLNLDAILGWTDAAQNKYGPTDNPFTVSEILPVLLFSSAAPTPQVLPGQSGSVNLTVQNAGGADAQNATVVVTNPDGSTASLAPFTLRAGQTNSGLTSSFVAPPVAAKGTAESDTAYLARLQAADNQSLTVPATLSWADATNNRYGPISATSQVTEQLPVVNAVLNGPASAGAGDKISYLLTLINTGHATATLGNVTVTLPDGSVQHPLAGTILAAGASVSTSNSFVVPVAPSGGSISAVASVAWTDGANSLYGPVSSTSTTQIKQSNKPPIVNAGQDQVTTLPINTVALNGSATDDGLPTGSTLTYLWTTIAGPGAVSFSSPNSPATAASFSAQGFYVLRLSVSDSQLTGSADVHITVLPQNNPPVVNAGPNQVITLPDNVVFLQGAASDDGLPAGSLLTTTWSLVSGPGAVEFGNPNAAITTALFTAPGVYDLRLSANDSQYLAASDVTITVNPAPNTSPGSITLNPTSASPLSVGANTQFQATVQDRNGVPITGAVVAFTVLGVNATTGSAQTNASGIALFNYTGVNAGIDQVSAAVSLQGINLVSNISPVSWVGSGGTKPAIVLGPKGAVTTLGLVGLCGAFTDSTGAVIEPISIGASPKQFAVPIGATQVQLGVNDDIFRDNQGSFVVTVDGVNFTVPGTAMPWRWVAGGLNGAFPYGVLDGTSPIVVQAGLVTGQIVSIAYQSGLVSAGVPAFPFVNGDGFGDTGTNKGSSGTFFATFYMNTSTFTLGERAKFTAEVTDSSGKLLPSQPVTFIVSGANPQQSQTVTDATGTATFTYHGFVAGADAIQADTVLAGATLFSNPVSISWTTVPNQPPSANAGPNQTISWPATNSVLLAGTATDDGLPNGTLVSSWTQTSGPAPAFIATPNRLSTEVLISAPGIYTFQLSVSDSVLSASSSVQITVSQANQPPVIRVVADTTSLTPPANTVTVSGTVTDDGLPTGAQVSVQWTQVNGPAGVSFTNPNSPSTKIIFPGTAGNYVLALTASDTQLSSSVNLSVTVNLPGPNQAPIVSISASQTSITLPNNVITLTGRVTDDGLPVGGGVSVQWSELNGPLPATISSPNTAITQVGFSAPGIYVLQLAASDTQLTGSANITISVNAVGTGTQQPPTVAILASQTAVTLPLSNVTLTGVVNDSNPNPSISTQWSQLNGPAPVSLTLSSPTVVNAAFPAAGVYGIQFTASDGQLSSSASVNITVTNPGGNQPPTVNAGPNQTIQLPQNTVTLNGYAADDGLPIGSTLSVNWSTVSGPGTVVFSSANTAATQATFSTAGTYVLQLEASDTQLHSASQMTVTVQAAAQQPPPAPAVALISPNDGDDVTQQIPVIGSVQMSAGTWVLAYSLSDTNNANPTWITFASGSNSINGTLGAFDPTMLLNGTYNIRLTATDTFAQSASTTISAQVLRNVKVGNFTLTFKDLSIPAPGLPITVTRTYDSRNKSVGDFGFGWTLGIVNIRLQKSRNLGQNWFESITSGTFPQYCLAPANNRFVTITFPDGRVYKFQAVSNPQCQNLAPIDGPTLAFVQLPTGGATAGATLAPLDGGSTLVDGSIPGPSNLIGFDGNIYDPTTFVFTTAEGFSYVIDQKLGATSVKDPNGNTLTINANGITSSAGQNVVFTRDGQGRITEIDDPLGNKLIYNYNGAGDLASFTDGAKNNTTFNYDPTHLLQTILDPRGIPAIKNVYDPSSGRLTDTIDADGHAVHYDHQLSANTEVTTNRLGHVTTYEYDDDGNILQKIQTVGGVQLDTVAQYDGDDNKTSELLPGHVKPSTFTYDSLGDQLTQIDPLGNKTTYQYNGNRQVTQVDDANVGAQHGTTKNIYDPHNNLTSTTDAEGHVTAFTYFPNGQVKTVSVDNVQTASFIYDAVGNVHQQFDANNVPTTFTYDANNNRLSQTVTRTLPDGTRQDLTTSYSYDGNNRLVQTTYPDQSFTQIKYNVIGKQSDVIDQLGHTTHYDYDNQGRLAKTTYADTTFEVTGYDLEGRRTSLQDRAGRVTTYDYDEIGRLTKTHYADESFTETDYDPASRVSDTFDQLRNHTRYSYDDGDRRTTVIDAAGKPTTFGYDNVGNQTSMTDALQHTTSFQYDRLGRRVLTTYQDQSTDGVHYDFLGRMDSKTDQAGKVTQYGYDNVGRLKSVTQQLNGNPLLTTYAYDEVGNRITQTDANSHTTKFAYDQLGRRSSRTLPVGMSESYGYDAAGNLTSKIDYNGHTTTYQYDTSNRLLSKTADSFFSTGACAGGACGATQVSFTYTNTGRRLSMTDASGVTNYSYDTRDRLLTKAAPAGTLTYTYDAAGNTLTLSSSNTGGASMTYGYDVLNRLSSVTDASGVTTYSYDFVGNLSGYTYPNGVSTSYTYDKLNRLTNMQSTCGAAGSTGALACGTAGTTIASYAYTLGPAGNRLSVAELSGRTVNYGYDDLYRLTSETITGAANQNGVISYTYDAVGNRTQRNSTVSAIPATGLLNYDANDRTSTDPYDANGSLLNSGAGANVYDFENRLVQAGGLKLVYDGDGNRVNETVATTTTQYLVADQNLTGYAQVLDEVQSGAVARTYSYGLELVSQRLTANSQGLSFYGFDGHGSVRLLTSSTGAVTDTYDYEAFGNLIASTGSTSNNYMFAGEQFDATLGIYYNQARYYDQRIGRFWTMDAGEGDLEGPLSLHKYLYVSANPVNKIDPTGNDDFTAVGQVTTAAVDSIVETSAEESDYLAYQALTNSILRGAIGFGAVKATGVAAVTTLTLAGLILLASVAPVTGGSSSEDVLLRNGHDSDNYAVFAFGDNSNSTRYMDSTGNILQGPRAPRILGLTTSDPKQTQDIVAVNGMVGPTDPPTGASSAQYPQNTRLTGVFWGISIFSIATIEGLGVIKDGPDATGGHHTIFPTRFMPAKEFVDKFFQLPWVRAGRKER
jgi:RHS repeat-associated protein